MRAFINLGYQWRGKPPSSVRVPMQSGRGNLGGGEKALRLPRGVYPEPFPYCHPERSEGSQGKGRDSSVVPIKSGLPQNDKRRRTRDDKRELINALSLR